MAIREAFAILPWHKDKLHLVYDFARERVVSARSNSIWNEKTFVLQWICTYNLHAAPRYQVEEETKNTRFICCTCAKGIFMYDTFTLISLFHSIYTICKRSYFSLFPSIQFLRSRCLKKRNKECEKNNTSFY